MKQIVVISGKGGTGKTVITASLAALAENKVMADCDVDAADLHLLLQPEIKHREDFRAGKTAVIDQNRCLRCGRCHNVCRFSAVNRSVLINSVPNVCFVIDSVACEGCGFCYHVCQTGAIAMEENLSGEWFISETRFGPMVHAKLGVAEENSGKLVSLVRSQAKMLAEQNNSDWILIDGSPGIGCPVIASLSGVDCALVVIEPTLSGLHDALRVIEVAQHFGIMTKAVINKYDLNTDMADKIESACREKKTDVVGRVSFDKAVVQAMVEGKTIIEASDSLAKQQLISIWENFKKQLF
jgi:MinD superfamily P-loop ATPase